MKRKKYNILAIIPARGGSKGIPGKNIKMLAGKPLIAYSIESALSSRFIDRVVVSTDDEEIAETAPKFGAEVIMRPKELAEDLTPMDPVLAHAVLFLEKENGYKSDFVMLLQPTSPLRTAEHIDGAVEKFLNGDFDSLASIFIMTNNQHEINDKDCLIPVFKEIKNRDERKPIVVENGAIYISNVNLIRQGKIRGERIGYYEMDRYASVDIDDLLDLITVQQLLLGRRQGDGPSA